FLKLPKTTVYRVAQEFNESNGNATYLKKTQDRSRSKKRPPEFLYKLQKRIKDDPGTSMRDLAAKMNVDEKTITTAVHEDLRIKLTIVFWSKEMWPPSSPNCYPFDFYVWGVLERESNKPAHNSIVSLKASILEAVASMNREHLVNACTRFQSKLEVVIETDGGWFE
ncbi:Uncharacterized protein FKW44_012930, partial [Caligus rogercresseyi]